MENLKENKTYYLRFRITESENKRLENYLQDCIHKDKSKAIRHALFSHIDDYYSLVETNKNQKLYHYGGDGFDNLPENGIYEVRFETRKEFCKLSEARRFFDSLFRTKAIWDMESVPELLDCYTLD